jgi:hypothetical protein
MQQKQRGTKRAPREVYRSTCETLEGYEALISVAMPSAAWL